MILRFLRRLLGRSDRAPGSTAAEGPPFVVAAPGDAPPVPEGVAVSAPGDVNGVAPSRLPPPPPPPPPVAPPPPPPPKADTPPPPPPPLPEPPVQADAPAPVPGVLPSPEPEEASRSAGGLRIRLLLSDGTVTEPTGDPELLERLSYLADNLLTEDEDRSRSE